MRRDQRKELGRNRLSLMQQLEGSVAIANARADLRVAIGKLVALEGRADALKFIASSLTPFVGSCSNE